MKNLIACILSAYILFLTVLPCVDVHAHDSFQREEITRATTNQHHQDYDQCSPFCTCDCCATHVIQKDNIVHFNFTSISERIITGYQSTYISLNYANIWHPPKIDFTGII